MELLGKIKLIGDIKTYGDNGFRKRELVLTTEDQYPQHILIEFVQNNCELLDNFSLGQTVRIGINIRGREWESPDQGTKYFNSIQGWRIESLDDQVMNSARPQSTVTPLPPVQPSNRTHHTHVRMPPRCTLLARVPQALRTGTRAATAARCSPSHHLRTR